MVTKAHDMLNVSDFQTKAVTFCRISSKDQEKGVSIEAQIQNVKSYCTAHNLSIIREFAITESSIQGDRKQYHQMIQFLTYLHTHKFQDYLLHSIYNGHKHYTKLL